jgi:hypothetical protein
VESDRVFATKKQNIINVILIAFVNALALDYHADPMIWHPLLVNTLSNTYQITGPKLVH